MPLNDIIIKRNRVQRRSWPGYSAETVAKRNDLGEKCARAAAGRGPHSIDPRAGDVDMANRNARTVCTPCVRTAYPNRGRSKTADFVQRPIPHHCPRPNGAVTNRY